MKNRIKLLRKDLKLTQKEFGDAIKVSNSNWSYVNILDTKSQTFLCCTSS